MNYLRYFINQIFLFKFILSLLRPRSTIKLSSFLVKRFLFRKKIPALAMLAVTFRCQCNCVHCSAGIYEKDEEELDLQSWKEVIDQLSRLGIPRIYFTGGEPLLRKDIFELINYTSAHGHIVFLETNGAMLSNEVVKKLKQAGVSSIDISLDSHSSKIHDSLRGMEGVFNKVIEGIKICKKERINTVISTYASKRSIASGDLKKVIELAKKLKVSAIRILPPYLSGRWLKNDFEGLSLREEFEANKVMSGSLPVLNSLRQRTCPINQKYILFVNPYGEIQPCAHLLFSFGNVKMKRIDDVIGQMATHKMFSKTSPCFTNNNEFRREYIYTIKNNQKFPIRIM